jgi:hypothetical protein
MTSRSGVNDRKATTRFDSVAERVRTIRLPDEAAIVAKIGGALAMNISSAILHKSDRGVVTSAC